MFRCRLRSRHGNQADQGNSHSGEWNYGGFYQLAVAVNGTVDASTPISVLVDKGEISGSAILSLSKDAVITLRNNSTTSFTMTSSPSIGAQMSVTKLSDAATLGYSYELATLVDATVVGSTDVPFNNNGPLSGIIRTASLTTITVPATGTYLVNYNVAITSGVGAQLAIAVNNTVDASTPITALVATGELSGSAILALAAGDVITLRNNSETSLTMTLAPGVGAQMSITRVDN